MGYMYLLTELHNQLPSINALLVTMEIATEAMMDHVLAMSDRLAAAEADLAELHCRMDAECASGKV